MAAANRLSLPRLTKIVVNMGVGKAVSEKKYMEDATEALKQICGQKPVITLSRKSIANFKLREGMPIGCKVTLRGRRMYEFLDRLVAVALPRVRDFRGLDPDAFDGRGNYNLGLTEQLVFPGAQPGQVHQPPGDEHHVGHQHRQRRRGPRVVAGTRHAAASGVREERTDMASKSKIAKAQCKPKFSTRLVRRCWLCGRPRAVYQKFGICRICFRKLADEGLIPGVRKASW